MKRTLLLTDTCSVFMLLACGAKLFTAGVLSRGDLVIHPQVWTETRKWPKSKKRKYQEEWELLHKRLGEAAASRISDARQSSLITLIDTAQAAMGLSVGYSDKVQLAVVLEEDDMELVTNDGPLQQVAEAFNETVTNAEMILLEAMEDGVVSKVEAQQILTLWIENGEPIKSQNKPHLRKKKLKL